MKCNGLPVKSPVILPSNGAVPFGFIFDQFGHLLVVEVGPNAVSSYRIMPNNTLKVISSSVINGQAASCWIAGNMRGYVFTGNAGTNTVSTYKLMTLKGTLALLDGAAGKGRLDLSTSPDGRFLYSLDPLVGNIDSFRIERDGSLTYLGAVDAGIEIFAQGIAVH